MALDKHQVLTRKVRFSYANVFEPRAVSEGDEAKYGVTLLIPKSDEETMAKIAMAMQAAKERFNERSGKPLPNNAATPIHDGDGEKPNGGEYGPECAGCWVIASSSKNPPKVLDANKNEIMDKTEFYSGCYGRAIISFYGYDNRRKGIGVGLDAVQKLSDGEPLGGSRVDASDFDDEEDLIG